METDKIYNMDCLEGMKQIPDASVDTTKKKVGKTIGVHKYWYGSRLDRFVWHDKEHNVIDEPVKHEPINEV